MPLDALCLRGIVHELQSAVDLRIEKIQQPARDQILLTLRGNRRLLLQAGGAHPRLHYTAIARENPAAPPMFCMLLRKHLSGGRILSITQPGLERIAILTIAVTDELGQQGQRQLVLEAMGRRANLLLVDGEGRIVDCLRRVDGDMNSQRQLLPGLFYRLPPAQEKLAPLETDPETLPRLLSGEGEARLDQALLGQFFGLSPLVCRELAFRTAGTTDIRLPQLTGSQWAALVSAFARWQEDAKENRFTPFLLRQQGAPADFSYLPITQYEGAMETEVLPSFSQLLDTFFADRERQERIRQKGQDLLRTATAARDRVARKLANQEREYAQTQDRERLRLYGELITANLYRMERGQRRLLAEDYYQEGCPQVEIPLDPLLSPQENAARYFKQYTKAKTAEEVLARQLEKGRQELAYLESVLDELSRAELEQDFSDIRAELREAGYLKSDPGQKKALKRPATGPRVFWSSSGLRILVGRNNHQNDRLVRECHRLDHWFHTQKIHGSHVILETGGLEPDEQSMTEAASLAAWFSQGRGGSQIPVDYTQLRYVKKPAGARPGMVVYDPYRTAYVTPDPDLPEHLSAKP